MEQLLNTTLSIATATVDQLEAIGGHPWRNPGGTVRVYFNDLPELFGLDLSFYKTGNVNRARLDGQTISNSQAGRYLASFESMKVWVEDGKLHCRARLRPLVDCDYVGVFADALDAKLQTLQFASS